MHQSLSIEPIRRTRTKFCRLVRDDRRRRLAQERGACSPRMIMGLALLGLIVGFWLGPRLLGL